MDLTEFDFEIRTRMVFGLDAIDRLGELAKGLGVRQALVVSDPGIVAAGHVQRGLDALQAAGIESTLFDGARENPTTREVAAGVEVARSCQPDLLVGLGGGSSMDCAKGINFLYTNGGQMQDYWGVGKATKEMLPMIAVPTTAGTGSEMQSFALISDPQTHVKMACGDSRASCRVAILDPRLTLTQPPQVTALTGVDALSHALETFVTLRRTAISATFSRQAFEWLASCLPKVIQDPADLQSRGGMQLGAALAGLAIENSMLGASHALANPLTARYGIAHGQAVGVMLPQVIRYNGQVVERLYGQLWTRIGGGNRSERTSGAAEALADWVEQMVDGAGLKTRLEALGVAREALPELAELAAKQWTGQFNPRPVDTGSLLELYQQVF